jgi:DNA (cytosine-5)-methyltransferase 1
VGIYVVVHGQIILQQFAAFPDESIQRSAFITGLDEKMKERRHTKLSVKKKAQVIRRDNLNPSAKMGPVEKRKLMRATTTRLINKIWGDYYATHFPDDAEEGDANDEPNETEEEQEETEDDEAEGEDKVEEEHVLRTSPSERSTNLSSHTCRETEWEGQTVGKTQSGEALYKYVRVRDLDIAVGGAVTVEYDSGEAIMCYVEYMYEKLDGTKMIHGRILQRGSQTVLGDAANEREIFLTNDCFEFEVGDIKESPTVNFQKIPWGHKYRKQHLEANRMERAKAEERKKKGLPMDYFCKSLYCPEKGAFFSSYDKLGTGTGTCSSCEERGAVGEEFKILSDSSFILKNVTYNIRDFLYVRPGVFSPLEGQGTNKAGRNVGLKPYTVCQLQCINAPAGSKKANPESVKVILRRLYRPEDISPSKAYLSDIREVLNGCLLFMV